MNVKVLKRTSNELKVEVEGGGHALCNLLQKHLLEEEKVDLAGYDIPHPLASNPIIHIRTKGAMKPEAVLRRAVERALETNKEFRREFRKALRKK